MNLSGKRAESLPNGRDDMPLTSALSAFAVAKGPLRNLLGLSWKDPILVVIITLMKLTKSK